MKPYVLGKNIFFREVGPEDAQFILALRTDPKKAQHLSLTPDDVEKQKNFIESYLRSRTDYYFVICNLDRVPVGTVRIYDIQDDSFCWGSWIMSSEAPATAAIESALMTYDYAFYALRYKRSHFDVRKANQRVVDFHRRFGARVVREDDDNYYFEYSREAYIEMRNKYSRFLP